MKSLMQFVESVLTDVGTACGTCTTRDLKTVARRYEHEGLSFLTITLSDFGKDFEKSLDLGSVAHDQFAGFSRAGGLPRFLGGFLELVFSRSTGRLLDSPSVEAIRAIRQFTLMWGKINLDCTDARRAKAIKRYLECEQEVRIADRTFVGDRKDRFERLAMLLWADPLQAVDEDVYYQRLIPRHGSGSTADSLKGNLKWKQQEWTQRLDEEFPFVGHLFSSIAVSEETASGITLLEPGAERPVLVISVPKTLKTPRIIAMEPTCMQYMQQGILLRLVKALRANDTAWSFIGFSSQTPNQELARDGSLKGDLATLDLSEASDRVSNQHVRSLLRLHPNLQRGVDATRSRKADVPGHGVIRLAKFASMGSALAFPFEAMVFATAIFVGIERQLNRPLTRKDIQSFVGKVRVYGDDIVVPVDYVSSVVSELQAYGFVVNESKSFWTGRFRESCGKEFYAGEDVSIVRLRAELPSNRQHISEIVSVVSTRNQLYKAGWWRATRYLDDLLERLIPFPMVAETSPVLGRHSVLGYETHRVCKFLHRPLVKGMVVTSVIPESKLDGLPALLKCLVSMELAQHGDDLVYAKLPDATHLERAGRPLTVNMKQRYASAV